MATRRLSYFPLAWKSWETPTKVKPNTVILHSQQYGAIPYADSEGLIKNSGLPRETLVVIGD